MLFTIALLCSLMLDQNATLQLEISNIRETKGKIRVGLFKDGDGFPDQGKVLWSKGFDPQTGKISVQIPDLLFGDYAIAVFHDLNGNGKLDRNMLGIPSEPYGFSGKASGKWSAPVFEDARISLSEKTVFQRIELFFWSER
ncbi:MAG: DUF2141 domain-containing protein [Saprospirales bacterium]|nr:DUF2141 domain-containing protein [Saprospirales bacterium]MBK6905396.1 DUF2141 domain-containing protein [Saprospirales bacterium]